ncbi:MAG: DUF2292 domain-containing protein [Lysinibacillus sp.]
MAATKDAIVEKLLEDIQKIQYGSVVITLHEGEITQVDITEKKRFAASKRKS